MWSRTCCLYEFRPWHQLFNTFGLIDVVRHVEQKGLQILEDAVIGDNFVACEDSTIGTNGFTMTEDESGNKFRIPTLGKVVIGNNAAVEIYSLTNISCGSAGNTIIEDNVKIDSLVHIGHDAYLGEMLKYQQVS